MDMAEKLEELFMHLNHDQASHQISRSILPEGHKDGILKKGTVKIQATMKTLTGIIVPYQYR